MAADAPDQTKDLGGEGRLGSWKAIAAYLQRDITTVQRWERREGMPVHRHVHDKRGSVYAFRSELDAWLKNRRQSSASDIDPEPVTEKPSTAQPIVRWIGIVAVLVVIAIAGAWWMSRSDPIAENPLANARISPLTDFEGFELSADISADGKFVAFLSDRDGTTDLWVTQIGTGEFHNLTKGRAPELLNPEVRSVAFTPDGSLVTMWTRHPTAGVSVSAVPTIGGALREFQPGAVELDWSSDHRLVYHTTDPGDPTFIVESEQKAARQIHVSQKGAHNHFQTWSPDDRHIYFVRGMPPDETDLWRMRSDGTGAERMTHHNARVLYPTFIDERTLLYLATGDDGSGPWLYLLDTATRTTRRVSFGVEQYTSLAASADGSRIVATVEHSKSSLWRMAISDQVANESTASRLDIPTVGASSPRLSRHLTVYVSAKSDGHAIWKLDNGIATELWSAAQTRVVGAPAISPDATTIAFSAERAGGTKLQVLDIARGTVRTLADSLEVRGAPAWAPDGQSITVAVQRGEEPHLYRVPLDGQLPSVLIERYAINPVWSPDGAFVLYCEADAGPDFTVKAVTASGAPFELPQIKLPRGARRVSFVPGSNALVVLQGSMRHSDFWHIDLRTGARRQLSSFGREFTIRDFDVSPDGKEIIFDRRAENSDLALIELAKQ